MQSSPCVQRIHRQSRSGRDDVTSVETCGWILPGLSVVFQLPWHARPRWCAVYVKVLRAAYRGAIFLLTV